MFFRLSRSPMPANNYDVETNTNHNTNNNNDHPIEDYNYSIAMLSRYIIAPLSRHTVFANSSFIMNL